MQQSAIRPTTSYLATLPSPLTATAPPLKSYLPLRTTFSEFILNNRLPLLVYSCVVRQGSDPSGESRAIARVSFHDSSLICNINLRLNKITSSSSRKILTLKLKRSTIETDCMVIEKYICLDLRSKYQMPIILCPTYTIIS